MTSRSRRPRPLSIPLLTPSCVVLFCARAQAAETDSSNRIPSCLPEPGHCGVRVMLEAVDGTSTLSFDIGPGMARSTAINCTVDPAVEPPFKLGTPLLDTVRAATGCCERRTSGAPSLRGRWPARFGCACASHAPAGHAHAPQPRRQLGKLGARWARAWTASGKLRATLRASHESQRAHTPHANASAAAVDHPAWRLPAILVVLHA